MNTTYIPFRGKQLLCTYDQAAIIWLRLQYPLTEIRRGTGLSRGEIMSIENSFCRRNNITKKDYCLLLDGLKRIIPLLERR